MKKPTATPAMSARIFHLLHLFGATARCWPPIETIELAPGTFHIEAKANDMWHADANACLASSGGSNFKSREQCGYSDVPVVAVLLLGYVYLCFHLPCILDP